MTPEIGADQFSEFGSGLYDDPTLADDFQSGHNFGYVLGFVGMITGAKSSPRASPVSEGVAAEPITVAVSRSKYPESAQHIDDAIAGGQPQTLTINRSGAAERRAEAMRGVPRQTGKDRDEYPPAMFEEGGAGASVRHIKPSDNRGAGACIGAQCRGLPDQSKVKIIVTD
ncbi:NucA/NucB deoxyribonuclease domain-containing protein [Permianibacter aggregans]|uniref:NucA/NucB deoxyribonuclease domain-containing protein n=1 Tax=Permianibacter aggregans TaxID=1510150 RepID=UPI0018DEF255|nr:NucA/NucB deoxyribonuclease domain-containing protein [Permianibacter aggregans]